MGSPELDAAIAKHRANPYTPAKSVEQLRAESEARTNDSLLPVGTTYAPLSADGVACEWIALPHSDPSKVFYFIHGGGYYRGSVPSSRLPAARLAAACGMAVLSVEYRLAPEHPFPAAIDDVMTAYRWLLAERAAADRVIVGGISAGGGLSAALLQAARRSGDPLPAGVVPLSPWMELTQCGASYRDLADVDPVISKGYLDRMAAYYLAGGSPDHPEASPLHGDLTSLPPQLLQVGSAETMLDDSVAYARAVAMAGSPVTLEVYPDAIHGWHGVPALPEADEAVARIAAFCALHVN
ncbi:MAG: alpha/beta hydrolase [Pseudomonadota bacterium]